MAPTKVIEAIKDIVEYSYSTEANHFEEEYNVENIEEMTIPELTYIDPFHIYVSLRILNTYLDHVKYGK